MLQHRHAGACPPGLWRAPTLKYGDVALFDYTIRHRGGANRHATMTRTAMYATLSRYWYKDGVFNEVEEEDDDGDNFPHHLMRAPRLAIPNGWKGDKSWRKLLRDSSKRQLLALEDFTHLVDKNGSTQDEEPDGSASEETLQQFVVSNAGFQPPGANQTLFLRVSQPRDENTIEEFPFDDLSTVLVEAYPGDELLVVTSDQVVVHTWKVELDQEQLVLSAAHNSTTACASGSGERSGVASTLGVA